MRWHLARALPLVVAISCGVCLGPSALAVQEEEPPQAGAVFRAEVERMLIHVSVLDERGRPVGGLEAEDFEVLQDGVPAGVEAVWTLERAPLDVALVLDFSRSVREFERTARGAAHHFLDSLGARDRVVVLPFNDAVGPGRRGAPGDPGVRSVVDGADVRGGTALFDALQQAFRELRSFPTVGDTEERRGRPVVVVTDGDDSHSLSTLSEAVLSAWRERVPVYAVGIGLGDPEQLERAARRSLRLQLQARNPKLAERLQQLLRLLAETTGGRLMESADWSALQAAYDEVLGSLRTSYVVAFEPAPLPDQEAVPEWVSLTVRLRGREPERTEVLHAPGFFRARGPVHGPEGEWPGQRAAGESAAPSRRLYLTRWGDPGVLVSPGAQGAFELLRDLVAEDSRAEVARLPAARAEGAHGADYVIIFHVQRLFTAGNTGAARSEDVGEVPEVTARLAGRLVLRTPARRVICEAPFFLVDAADAGANLAQLRGTLEAVLGCLER